MTAQLQQFLLELARKAPTVALRLHWYLEAFCGLHHESSDIKGEIEQTPASEALYKLMETVQVQAGVETRLAMLNMTFNMIAGTARFCIPTQTPLTSV